MIFAVTRRWCGSWDFEKPLEQQLAWREHADFMNALEADGYALLAGPVGVGDQKKVLIIVRADSADEVQALLARDPWSSMGMLETLSIEPWEIRLGSFD